MFYRLSPLFLCLVFAPSLSAQAPPDSSWKTNTTLKNPRILTRNGLGAAQGVSIYRNKIYIYGDVYSANPRVGVIREYDLDLQPTGRVLWLRKNGKPLLLHPTGLTWGRWRDKSWGTFLGDTVEQKAKIFQLDWDQAWKNGNLDHSVKRVVVDDAAINGCRPLLVTYQGKKLLATADYGDVRPEIRLYDPEKLLEAKRSSAKGVLVHRISCGPFNQNLAWDEKNKYIICVQNVVAGRGWQLDVLDLAKAIQAGKVTDKVRVKKLTFPPHTELEGFRFLGGNRGIFVTAHPSNNVVIGQIVPTPTRTSPPGTTGFKISPTSK